MDKLFLTTIEFSKCTGIGICRVRDMCNIDGFPAAKNGKNYLIHKDKAVSWLLANKPQPHKRVRD